MDLKELFLYDGLDVCDPISNNLNTDYISASAVGGYYRYKTALFKSGTTTVINNQDVVIGTLAFELAGHGFATGSTDIKAATISGTVTYNHSTKTLTMQDAKTTSGVFKPYLDNLKLELYGTNTLNYTGDDEYNSSIDCGHNLTIQGRGKLITGPIKLNKNDSDNIFYLNIKGGATVTINNSKDTRSGVWLVKGTKGLIGINASTLNINVKETAVCCNTWFQLEGSVINSPTIVRLIKDDDDHYIKVMDDELFGCYDLDRLTPHKGTLSIVPGTAYKLWVNGVQVNSKNYNQLSSALNGGGTCSFNPTTKTLTMNNAKISYEDSFYETYPAIFNGIDGLIINNSGTSEMGGPYNGIVSEADFTIKGTGQPQLPQGVYIMKKNGKVQL